MSDRPVFGDDDPEDAWCPTDALDVLLDDLRRRAALLDPFVPTGGDPDAQLDALADIVTRARTRGLDGHDLERANELEEDIGYLRSRL